jgi:hypothetical protein
VRRTAALVAVLCVLGLGGILAAGAQAQFTTGSPQQLTGGLTQVTLGGLAVARDGTGGLVYTAMSDGVSHVFFSRLLGGVFQGPQQLDTGALTSGSQPVISADNGGQVLVAFISGSNLYAADALSSAQGLSNPVQLASGAQNPAISMNLYGIGYVAYSASSGSGDDLDVQYFDGSGWAAASPEAMNNSAGDVAGVGTDAPSVVAASDGVGIVAWGEGGHVYSRRVLGTQTSVEVEQDDVSNYNGLSEIDATAPDIASGGDSTYPDIVFSETFAAGSGVQTRAMLTRLVAERTQPATSIDSISSGSQNGLAPQVAMSEFGRGLITAQTAAVSTAPASTTAVTSTTPASTLTTATTTTSTTVTAATTTGTGTGTGSTSPPTGTGTATGTATAPTSTGTGTATTTTATTATSTTPTGTTPAVATTPTPGSAGPFGIAATALANNGAAGNAVSADPSPDASDPDAVPATFGQTITALAWDQDGGSGLSEIELSYAADGVTLESPVVLSSVNGGTIQPADGLLLAGDSRGDGVAAWVQGSSPSLSVQTAQLYTPEGRPGLDPATVDAHVSQPLLNWNAAAEDWGSILYSVSLNGNQIDQTPGTSLILASLTDGTYSWGVTASNTVGNVVDSGAGKLVVDTFAPRLRVRLTGTPRPQALQHLTIADSDPPNPTEPGARASGVKSVTVSWGDASRAVSSKKLTQTHSYAKAGVYTVSATVADMVGNTTTLTRTVRVLP